MRLEVNCVTAVRVTQLLVRSWNELLVLVLVLLRFITRLATVEQ